MIKIAQANEGYEVEGSFKIYGTREQLLKMASQLRYGAGKVEIGWVEVDPDADIVVDSIRPFRGVQ